MKMAALAMSEDNSDLASQCMAFCQALASKGQTFSFTLNVGPSFTFSLDTRGNGSTTLSKKRKSPSTQRRNSRIGGEQSFWPRRMVLYLRENFLWKRRLHLRTFSSVTNVRTTSNLKTA